MNAPSFVARQAIVDRRHRLVAYELLFRHAGGAHAGGDDDGFAASHAVVSSALLDMGTKWLLGDTLAFVNMGTATLLSDLPTLLPPHKVVIEILEDVVATPRLLERVVELRAAGFRFALDDYDHRAAARPLLPLASYVKLDVLALAPRRLEEIVAALGVHPVRLVAEKIETRSQFDACLDQRFDLFQGYYFAHPEAFARRVVDPSQATLLQALERVAAGAGAAEIAALLRRDEALAARLLHAMNVSGLGSTQDLRCVEHVIAHLDRGPLVRWLAVLLATSGHAPTAPPLARTALVRGRLCELLGGRVLGGAERDGLFVTGAFSLLDAMLGVPLQDVLAHVPLPERVAAALSGRGGAHAPVLALVEALESRDVGAIARCAASAGLDPADVTADHLRALAWAERFAVDWCPVPEIPCNLGRCVAIRQDVYGREH